MTTFLPALGLLLCAGLYGFLTLLLLTGWKGRAQGVALTLAAGLTALWAGVGAFYVLRSGEAGLILQLLEIARSWGWLFFLLQLLKSLQSEGKPALAWPDSAQRVVSVLAVLLAASILLAPTLAAPAQRQIVFFLNLLAPLTLAVAGMALVEQLYRSTRAGERWSIKFLCLGVGGLFVYDFFLYSHALLFRQLDPALWLARGMVDAMVMPLITISAARNPQWALVAVSRRLAFHTATLLGAGLYLLGMAAAGYYLRAVGGSWGALLQTVFFFGAILLLAIIIFSGTLRARLRVFLSKHFYSYRYDYREEWLKFTRSLGEQDTQASVEVRCIEAIAHLVESPGGALWLKSPNQHRYVRKAHWNWAAAEGEENAQSHFIDWLAQKQWVIHLEEYAAQPELYQGLEVPGWLSALPQAWLVVPLVAGQGLLGFIVITRSIGKIHFNWEVHDLLKTAARQAAAHLAQEEAAQSLAIARQFESFNRATAFVVHDLKNIVAQLSLMLDNAAKYKHNAEFQQDMMETVDNAVARMNKLLGHLRGEAEAGDRQPVELGDLLRTILQTKSAYRLKPRLNARQALWVDADRDRLIRVLGHIVQNAIEATPHDGDVALRLKQEDGHAVIEVEDTGRGMDDEFVRERLFRPFDSTKGSGMGIGAYECREYVHELNGKIDVVSRPGEGTLFRISLPLARNEAIA
jgi:putative PEP-CTERM system histidine kinase